MRVGYWEKLGENGLAMYFSPKKIRTNYYKSNFTDQWKHDCGCRGKNFKEPS